MTAEDTLPGWQRGLLRNVDRHLEVREEEEAEAAKVVQLNPPRIRPVAADSVKNPLRATDARCRWLGLIESGAVVATSCRVWAEEWSGIVWYVRASGAMSTWIHHPQVRPLWVAGRAFGQNREHVVRLTSEGRRLVASWGRA